METWSLTVGALHVDLEDDVAAGRQRVADLVARRAVPVAVDLVGLEELARGADAQERLAADEVVVDAVDLAVARRTGREVTT